MSNTERIHHGNSDSSPNAEETQEHPEHDTSMEVRVGSVGGMMAGIAAGTAAGPVGELLGAVLGGVIGAAATHAAVEVAEHHHHGTHAEPETISTNELVHDDSELYEELRGEAEREEAKATPILLPAGYMSGTGIGPTASPTGGLMFIPKPDLLPEERGSGPDEAEIERREHKPAEDVDRNNGR